MRRRGLLLSTVGALVVACLVLLLSGGIRWRAHVLALYLTGQISDIGLKQLLAYMRPGSGQYMQPLVQTHNPYAVIRNVKTTPADVQAGAILFRSECAECHGPDGSGGRGPALLDRAFTHGESDWAVYRTIRFGIPNTAMGPHPLPETALWQVVAFVRSLDRGGTASATGGRSASGSLAVSVPYEELAAIREPAGDWLTYSGSYASSRHSALTQINRVNVRSLALRWIYPFAGEAGDLEVSPVVRNGVMFVTQPPGRVTALDATTGKPIWVYDHKASSTVAANEFYHNRGVAILNDKVFFGTPDGRLVAVSAATGALQWEARVATDWERYSITSAPLAYRDLVVTGVAIAGEAAGGQGFIAAYDANTGRERWRFVTIPQPGAPGSETWEGDSWRGGGAPTWLTGSYDPELDLLIWPVGNPKPDYDAAVRRGDNLYSNCAVALRGSTGELVWYFQFTPGDDHDWDANQIPVLADRTTARGTEKRILWANRNGFYYILDRVSGKFLAAAPFVQQTWTEGLDLQGRPKPVSSASRNREGVLQYPGYVGATNWWSPSFDPALNLMFVPVLEQGMAYFTSLPPQALGGRPFYTAVRALDASTGKMVWEHRRAARQANNLMGGVLSTAGGVVFGGDEGVFFALDSRTGRPLWSVETGGTIRAAAVTFVAGGEQLVTIAAGRNLLTFALPRPDQPGAQ
ncbi:MAG TPA: PQQ-binding-like beta-propeller repeat protein [Gemmatimonadales bacterium]|jgi:alcohol dehydrogenase (cytochrome c)|nr:PQQ-binding-like beta-propeller repeat protein [Gemmatimonadales bacterium]